LCNWQAILASVLLLIPNVGYTISFIKSNEYPPVSNQGREQWLSSHLPTYPLYEWLNKEYGTHYRVYAVFDERMFYYTEGVHEGDWFGVGSYFNILGPSLGKDGELSGVLLDRRLVGLGAQFLLIPANAVYITKIKDFSLYFYPIKIIKYGVLFRVNPY